MRNFETGATRDVDNNKFDYEGFLSPLVLERFAEYMHKNRFQADGKIRDSDNWQKGIPKDVYMKSAFRHFMDVWKEHRGIPTTDGMEQAIAAVLFNLMGYLHETLKEKQQIAMTATEANAGWDKLIAEATSRENEFLQPLVNAVRDVGQKHWRGEGLEVFIYDPAPGVGTFVIPPHGVLPTANTTGFFHNGEEQAVGHFTHRYGALAHDAEAIEDDNPAEEGYEAARKEYENLYKPLQGKEYTTDNDPAFPRSPGMEHG